MAGCQKESKHKAPVDNKELSEWRVCGHQPGMGCVSPGVEELFESQLIIGGGGGGRWGRGRF